MRELGRELVRLLLPPACAGCGSPVATSDALCPRCADGTERLARRGCLVCQGPRPAPDAPRCAACARAGTPLAACVAEAAFVGAVAAWIRRFKYPQPGLGGVDPRPAAVVGELAVRAAQRLPPPPPDLIVPVPMHPRRLRARGFHPAGELARRVGRALGRPVDPRMLRRVRDTASQTGLDRRARRRNVEGAFRACDPVPSRLRVCLVDDVVTTGATLAEAARALRRAGARRIVAVAAARTPPGE